MRTIVTLFSLLFAMSTLSIGQEKLEVEGAIIIHELENGSPPPGTIQWTGTDYEGWNGNDWISLTGGAIKDIDKNTYKIVTIGTQSWMAENLRVTRYNDGTAIPLVTDNTAWSNLTTPGFTFYNNGGESPEYGALYNYYAVADTNSRNVCPVGWHVPSNTEWTTLANFLGGSSIAGGKMKEAGLAHWSAPNTGAINESGFMGLPGGYRDANSGAFSEIGKVVDMWSSTQHNENLAWVCYLGFNGFNALKFYLSKGLGGSVRCIRDL